MDYEIETMTSNHTLNGTYTRELAAQHLVRAVAVTICMLIGVAGNLTLVYIIFHHKRLRTLTNIVLANWAIADTGFLLSSSGLLDLIVYFDNLDVSTTTICIEFQLEQSFAIAVKIFMNWMCINWCLGAYWPDKQAMLRKHYKGLLGIIWAGVVCWAVKCTILCSLKIYPDYTYLVHLLNILMLLIVFIAIHILHAIKKFKQNVPKQSSLMKTIVSVLMVTWLAYYTTYLNEPSDFIGGLIYCVLYLNSVMVILVLLKFHKGFRQCFFRTMKCSRYSSSLTDDSSEERTVDQTAHVELDFN